MTAALLHEGGHEVVGVTMKTWDHAAAACAPNGRQQGCCSVDDVNDARAVAVRLGIPHMLVDIRDEFGDWVIDRFEADYLAGRTPNPCVLCNTHIKWAALLKRADALGCSHIATGHYARVRAEAGRTVLSRGVDARKDQSYALWGVAQEHLARTLLPLGERTKPEIRALAQSLGLEEVAGKRDSYEICFVPQGDYRDFLRRRVPGLDERVEGGAFVWEPTGETVGRHEGYPFYTVGQRKGLGLALGEPAYVTRIDAASNTVYLGRKEALAERTLWAGEVVFGKDEAWTGERRVLAQVRYHDPGAPALARVTDEGYLAVVFEQPRSAVAPGQALVLYDGDDVLAGGWITQTGRTQRGAGALGEGFVPLPVL